MWIPLLGAVMVVLTQAEEPARSAGVESITSADSGTLSSILLAPASTEPEFITRAEKSTVSPE